MNTEIQNLKFELLVKDISEALDVTFKEGNPLIVKKLPNCDNIWNCALYLLFDYDELNSFASTIVLQSSSSIFYNDDANWTLYDADDELTSFDEEYDSECSSWDVDDKITKGRELVKLCRAKLNSENKYLFIFWALMILAVDKDQGEDKLSLICDYATLVGILDVEMEDLVQIVKLILHRNALGVKQNNLTYATDFETTSIHAATAASIANSTRVLRAMAGITAGIDPEIPDIGLKSNTIKRRFAAVIRKYAN